MKIPCDYCGQMISDTEQNCPYCGGANRNVKRGADNIPSTIQELKDYCEAHHLPLQAMRVFIGENYREAKAYGIYQDEATGYFIVYKNKADGSRAIRYEGNDEAYAVNELYLKINARVAEQKSHQRPQAAKTNAAPAETPDCINILNFFICAVLPFILVFYLSISNLSYKNNVGGDPNTGYYLYEDSNYYYYHSDWYIWEDTSWTRVQDSQVDSELNDHYQNYYLSSYYNSSYEAENFTDSGYYSPSSQDSDWNNDWNNDWDSDYDWDDSYDWDTSLDDWDSDW